MICMIVENRDRHHVEADRYPRSNFLIQCDGEMRLHEAGFAV